MENKEVINLIFRIYIVPSNCNECRFNSINMCNFYKLGFSSDNMAEGVKEKPVWCYLRHINIYEYPFDYRNKNGKKFN
jgi:hypothetical protein